MRNFRIRLKRRVLKNKVQIKDALNELIQPFKELPSVINTGIESDRIDAHDLFSHYTADIIREDVIFSR